MRSRIERRALALGLALILGGAGTLWAGPVSTRIPFEAGEWIRVDLEKDRVQVREIRFHQPRKVSGVLARHTEPNRATVILVNTGDHKVDAGVAVACFSKDGTLLAAGNSGKTLGTLRPGERHELTIHFTGVFHSISKAAYFYLALEV